MATLTKPGLLDETFKNQQSSTNALLASISTSLRTIASAQADAVADMDYNAIKAIVDAGNAPAVFPTGTQLVNTYTDKDGKTYDCPWDVVQPDDTAEGESGTTAPAMVLQMHYATLYDTPFSAYQAFYVVPDGGLVAGTYNVKMGLNWGDNVKTDATYQFTLTKAAPAGARLAGFYNAPVTPPTSWKVYVYKDQEKSELLETCSVTAGSAGSNLGTFLAKENGNLNGLHPVGYGDNRWWKSACRQYLNSDAAVGAWWKPQDKWDMKPDQADTLPGFLSGFSDDFKNALSRVKVVTYGNTVTDDGSAVVTYDKIFLPSLQEIYCSPQVSGEGTYWPYWKERTGAKTPQALWQTYPLRITRDLAQRTVGLGVRLRSAHRGSGNGAFYVTSSGGVYGWPGVGASRSAPACKITKLA
uniref:DUF6273 domain-containing protein n=1 Tax=Siphoviridae sp. ct0Ci105 TaxID=2825292 RepID=A0A8S5P9C7_9CAUD|nr:MAG TPA: hypothetical protein [Siphoviridae sp. ct0Ci105]